MKITHISDWSSEPCSNLQGKNSPSKDNAWEEVNNENKETNRLKISSMCSLLQGLLIGSLSIGVVLAIVLTVWLTSPHSTSTNINSTLSSTTSITTSLSSNSTTSITSSTTAISTTQSTTSTSTSIILTTYTTTVPPNLLVNSGGESGTLSPWNSSSSGVPTLDDGSANNGINPHSGSKDFYGGSINTGSTNTLTQSVCLLNGTQGYTETQLDSGSLTVNISFYEISLSQSQWFGTGTDQGQISLQFRTSNNTLISTITTPTFTCTSWCGQSYSFSLPIGTRCIDYIMVFRLVTGNVIDSYFDDNSLTVY